MANVAKSPFPGMDPYLENPDHWPDFHSTFIVFLRKQILSQLPIELYARVEESVLLLAPRETLRFGGDVVVTRESGHVAGRRRPTLQEPGRPLMRLANTFDFDEGTYPFIEVIDKASHKVLTVVELLSPSNKRDNDWTIYRDKRQRLLAAGQNLIEIDLLREGRRLQFSGPLPALDYFAFVSRKELHPECDIYAWSLRDRMPVIPIPLTASIPDAMVDIQHVFELAFEHAEYGRQIDYSLPPVPPLTGDNADFVASIIPKKAS